jgi:hypothetical protein
MQPRHNQLAELFRKVFAQTETVILFSPHGEDDIQISVPGKTVSRSTLTDALQAVLGLCTHKRCPCCGEHKGIGQFGIDASRADGLNKNCRICANQHRTSRDENRIQRKRRCRCAGGRR